MKKRTSDLLRVARRALRRVTYGGAGHGAEHEGARVLAELTVIADHRRAVGR